MDEKDYDMLEPIYDEYPKEIKKFMCFRKKLRKNP